MTSQEQSLRERLADIFVGEPNRYYWADQILPIVQESNRQARLIELQFLLEYFGIEDNTQPIKTRIKELAEALKAHQERKDDD